MPVGLVGFDKRYLGVADGLVGIDEAGRGCLAGPVVAAAVWCQRDLYYTSWCRRNSCMVDDSKRLTASQRAAVVERFKYAIDKNWIRIAIGTASIAEIEQYNIYHANSLAMRRALQQLAIVKESTLWDDSCAKASSIPILIDGKRIRAFPVQHEAVVKGDRKSLAIALAGIHAKQQRDHYMDELDREYPQYHFSQHKGYGTELHVQALKKLGPCGQHRPSFLKKILDNPGMLANHRQDSLF